MDLVLDTHFQAPRFEIGDGSTQSPCEDLSLTISDLSGLDFMSGKQAYLLSPLPGNLRSMFISRHDWDKSP
jgi:hypothetical protein